MSAVWLRRLFTATLYKHFHKHIFVAIIILFIAESFIPHIEFILKSH